MPDASRVQRLGGAQGSDPDPDADEDQTKIRSQIRPRPDSDQQDRDQILLVAGLLWPSFSREMKHRQLISSRLVRPPSSQHHLTFPRARIPSLSPSSSSSPLPFFVLETPKGPLNLDLKSRKEAKSSSTNPSFDIPPRAARTPAIKGSSQTSPCRSDQV